MAETTICGRGGKLTPGAMKELAQFSRYLADKQRHVEMGYSAFPPFDVWRKHEIPAAPLSDRGESES